MSKFKKKVIPAIIATVVCLGVYQHVPVVEYAKDKIADFYSSLATGAPTKHYDFKEGKQWTRIANPIFTGKDTVTEFFWYNCGHCSDLQDGLVAWKTGHSDIAFEYVPVTFGSAIVDARDYYSMELSGLSPKVVMGYLKYRQSDAWNSGRLRGYLESVFTGDSDQSKDTIQKVMAMRSSPALEDYVNKATALADQVGVKGVPAIVVSGKYKVNMTSLTGTFDELEQLITFLIKTQP